MSEPRGKVTLAFAVVPDPACDPACPTLWAIMRLSDKHICAEGIQARFDASNRVDAMNWAFSQGMSYAAAQREGEGLSTDEDEDLAARLNVIALWHSDSTATMQVLNRAATALRQRSAAANARPSAPAGDLHRALEIAMHWLKGECFNPPQSCGACGLPHGCCDMDCVAAAAWSQDYGVIYNALKGSAPAGVGSEREKKLVEAMSLARPYVRDDDIGHHHCRKCDAGTHNGWKHAPGCAFVASSKRVSEVLDIIDQALAEHGEGGGA